MIELNCGECGKVLRVADRYRGQSGRCNGCGAIVNVPSSDTTVPCTDSEEDFVGGAAETLTDSISDPIIHDPTQAQADQTVIYDNRFKFGLLGSITLFVGVFAPIVSLPIVGSINYLSNGKGDGVLVLVLALISFALVFSRKYKGLWITSLASIGLLLFTFINFQLRISGLKDELQTDLEDNPFAGMADVMISSTQLQWGWALLVVGSGLLIASAAMKEKNGESTIELPKLQEKSMAILTRMLSLRTKHFRVLLGVGLGVVVIAILVVFKSSILASLGTPSPAARSVSTLPEGTGSTTETGQRNEDIDSQVIGEIEETGPLNEDNDSQVISEIEGIHRELREIAELRLFAVIGARFYFVENTFSEEPVIEITVLNKTAYPVSRAYFYGTLKSPGRSVPWLEDSFSYEIRGGLEPGEEATWKLAPNIFGEWADAPKNRNDMVLYVQTTRIDGANGEPIIDFITNDDYRKRELELNARLTELQKVLPGYTPTQRPTHIPEPPVAVRSEPETTTPAVTGNVYTFDGEYHASKDCSKITSTPGMMKGEAALKRKLTPCDVCY